MSYVIWAFAFLILVFGFGIWWARRTQTAVLEPLFTVLDRGVTAPTLRSVHGDVWLYGSRHGRAVRLGLLDRSGEGGPLWRATFDLACDSAAFFDVGLRDGPESYIVQIPEPALRAAVHRLVETYQAESVALNASSPPLPPPYRLRVTIEHATREPSVSPTTARGLLDEAELIARLVEK